MRDGSNNLLGTYNFRTCPLGAGGFVIGMDWAADGSWGIHWADVFSGYERGVDDDVWLPILRFDNFDTAEWDPWPPSIVATNGLYSGRIAPSNVEKCVIAWKGLVFKRETRDGMFERTAFAVSDLESNGYPHRRFNRTLDIHPTDDQQWIIGTMGNGVFYTLNNGTSYSAVGSLPTPGTVYNATASYGAKYLVAYDPGAPSNVYIHVYGHGVYRSTTGVTGSFSLISGSPAQASNMVVTPNGTVYVCQYRTSGTSPTDGLKRLLRGAGSFTTMTGTTKADQFAYSPFNENHIVWVDENSGGWVSSIDGGTTWNLHGSEYRGEGETEWFSNRYKALFPSQIMFDPVTPNKLWVAEGVGIGYIDVPFGTNDQFIVHDFSNGNEELIPTIAITSPNNIVPLIGCQDKAIWRLLNDRGWTNKWSTPKVGNTLNGSEVAQCRFLDWAIDDPDFVAAVVHQDGDNGYSEDWGLTFTAFDPQPTAAPGGCIAVSNRDNMILVPGNNAAGYYTKNGGTSWSPLMINGKHLTHWMLAAYVQRKCIAADKQRPGVFAAMVDMYNPVGGANNRPEGGLWLSTDGGDTWVQKYIGIINAGSLAGVSTSQTLQAKLDYVPGYAGELIFASCRNSSGNKLLWSQDDGATWADMHSSVRNVLGWGFGKAAPGKTRPTLFIYGYVSGVRGLYVSTDWLATTPSLISRYPNGQISPGSGGGTLIEGDMNRFGRCYVGMPGNGWVICDYAGTCDLI